MPKPLFRLHCLGLVFTPKLIPSLGFLIILPILLLLGRWQLQRADYKIQLKTTYQQRQHATPLTLKQLKHYQNTGQNLEYYPVKLTGTYDNQHSIFIDNKILNRLAGYQVLTPFIPAGSHTVLLVNRGWLPRLRNRQQLPPLQAINGVQVVTGMIKTPPKKTFLLAKQQIGKKWPLLLQAPDLKLIHQALGQPIYPFILLLSKTAAHGFDRQWPITSISANKHWGYAIQWFALALTLVIMYLFFNIRRDGHEPNRKRAR